jgi:hypothetical protein
MLSSGDNRHRILTSGPPNSHVLPAYLGLVLGEKFRIAKALAPLLSLRAHDADATIIRSGTICKSELVEFLSH